MAMRSALCVAQRWPRRSVHRAAARRPLPSPSTLHGGRRLHTASPASASATVSNTSSLSRWSLVAALAAAATASAVLLPTPPAESKASAAAKPAAAEDEVDESLESRNAKAFKALQSLLGDRLSVDADDRSIHGRDANSYHKDKAPWAIAYPQSTEEVSNIAKVCFLHRVPMIPYGSGTSLEGHTSAPSGGVVIDVSHMNAVKEVHEADMDVVVEPGITWNDLNSQLQDKGLFYPVDPGPGASIGGMCGTSCSGTNAVRYGTMRQNVLNLTVVLADGTILKTAQRARKSSAGYNLTHFFIGSEGTLGIITEATLRLQNIPEQTAVAVCSFPSVHHAAGAAIAVMRKGVQIGAVELLDENAIKAVNQYVGLSLNEVPTIFFKFHGSEVGVKDEVRQVEALVGDFQGSAFDWASDKKRREQIWEGRKGALWAVMAYRPENQVWTTDVCVPISRLADCITATKKDIDDSGILAPIVGHVGDGNFHVLISVDTNDETQMKAAKSINQRMVQRAIEMEGTCTGEHGVGVGKRDYLDHELGVSTVETMRKLKKALDPHGLMNPGKVFRLKAEGDDGGHGGGGVLARMRGVVEGLMGDTHDEEHPSHAAYSSGTSYVGAPAGKLDKDPPKSTHDASPPPRRD